MQSKIVIRSEEDTPQGGPISCVLANIYLHFALDLWFEKEIKPQCRSEGHLVHFVSAIWSNLPPSLTTEPHKKSMAVLALLHSSLGYREFLPAF